MQGLALTLELEAFRPTHQYNIAAAQDFQAAIVSSGGGVRKPNSCAGVLRPSHVLGNFVGMGPGRLAGGMFIIQFCMYALLAACHWQHFAWMVGPLVACDCRFVCLELGFRLSHVHVCSCGHFCMCGVAVSCTLQFLEGRIAASLGLLDFWQGRQWHVHGHMF